MFAGAVLAGNLSAAEVEGSLKPFLSKPHMDVQPVFRGERFGNIVVSMKGTVIATWGCLLYTSPSPRDKRQSRMPSSA